MLLIMEAKWGHFSSTASWKPEVWHVSLSPKTLHFWEIAQKLLGPLGLAHRDQGKANSKGFMYTFVRNSCSSHPLPPHISAWSSSSPTFECPIYSSHIPSLPKLARAVPSDPDHRPWVRVTWINWTKWTLNPALSFPVILYVTTDVRIRRPYLCVSNCRF